MKNYMKKIIVGFTAFVLLFLGANSAFASGPFNGQSGDCRGMSIGNYTTGSIPRDSDGCWTANSISGSSGDTINVGVYYHNNTGGTLTNVRAVVNKSSSGPNNSYSFTGTLSSDQGTTSLGTVNLNLSSSQTLTYSSTHLMKGKSAVLADTDTSVIYNENGIDVGSVPPGWNDFGSIVFVYKVGTNGNNNNNNNCTISDFTINGSSSTTIRSGNSANLYWNTSGCTSVTVSGPNGFNNSSTNGSQSVFPTNSGTYTINAYGNNGGNVSRTVYVTVDNYDNNNYCVINTFTVNSAYPSTTISSGSVANLVWNTSGCNSVTVSGPGVSSNAFYGAQQLYPTSTSQYTITAYGNNGNAPSRTVSVGVTSNPIIVSNTCAVTLVATNISQTGAVLNGVLTNPSGTSYFEYGRTISLGSQTQARTAVNGTFSEAISGLSPNTSYYFRPVTQCNGGLSYGLINTFTTLGTGIIRQVIVQGNTVVGTASPIMLKIENRYQAIALGDMVDYTVTYKNIGKTTLTKPVLQVIIPRGIVLVNASRGTYALDTNTLTVPLEDLLPLAEGVVYLQGRVDSILSNTAQVVTTAILVYTSKDGAQENAIAYVLNNPRVVSSTLGASAFFSGFGGIGLIGWLLILILILLVILLTRRFYGNKSVVRTTNPSGTSTTTTHY